MLSLNKSSYLSIITLIILVFTPLDLIASIEDVSINSRNGDTFIIERIANPNGKLTILNDYDENFVKELSLLDFSSDEATFEIELISDNKLVYLVQVNNMWMINSVVNYDGEWIKSPKEMGLTGYGKVSNLIKLPGERVALNLSSDQEKVIIIESNNSHEIVEEIPANAINKRLSIIHRAQKEKILKEQEKCKLNKSDCEPEELRGMGMTAGLSTGFGFAYRRYMINKWGYQIAGLVLASNETFVLNVGFNLNKTLHKAKRARLLLIMGTSVIYGNSLECNEDRNGDCYDNNGESWEYGVMVNFGVGIGIEFLITESIGLTFELPLVLTIGLKEASDTTGIRPIPSLSVVYYF
jgi:hypothetical protein